MPTKHKVFLLRRVERIRERECTIVVKHRTTWAIDDNGRKYLLGSTAFYTLKAAERAKVGRLQKMVASTWLPRYWRGELWARAKQQLANYNAKGTFH